MLKAKDLRERSLEDLRELEKTLTGDTFQARFKNFTNRLDNTSAIKAARRDVARVKTILVERAKGLTPVEAEPKAPAAPKVAKAPKAAAASKPAAAPKAAESKPAAPKKTAKKTTAKGEAK